MTQAELLAAGFDVSPQQHARLAQFLDLLLRENEKLNLTGIRTLGAAWPLHICDSLAALPWLPDNAAQLLDLGTGGGVPGIPIACCRPALHVTLLDATRKKIDAIARMLADLPLPNVTARWGRSEQLAEDRSQRGAYAVVVARAVAPFPDVLLAAGPLVALGGVCLLYESLRLTEADLQGAEPVLRRAGFVAAGQLRYELPAPHGGRQIMRFRKTTAAPPPSALRRPAARSPRAKPR